MELHDALQQLMAVENNKTTDELTKWREYCYNQLVEIKLCHIKSEKKEKLNKKIIEKLESEIRELSYIIEDKKNEYLDIKERISKSEVEKNDVISKFDKVKEVFQNAKSNESQIQYVPRIFSEKVHIYNEKIDQILTNSYPMVRKMDELDAKISKMLDKITDISNSGDDFGKTMTFEQKKLACENCALKISMKMEDVIYNQIPDDIIDLSKEYKNTEDASIALDEIRKNISDLRENMKPYENGIIHCTDEIDSIVNLIAKEERAQVERRIKLDEQYDINQLEDETKQSQEEILKCESQLKEIANNFKQLDEELRRAVEQLSDEEAQNNLEIEDLKNQLDSLHAPTKCINPKDVETRTIIDSPLL